MSQTDRQPLPEQEQPWPGRRGPARWQPESQEREWPAWRMDRPQPPELVWQERERAPQTDRPLALGQALLEQQEPAFQGLGLA